MNEPAGIWTRVSSGGQDEANQVPDTDKHCAAHGYDVARRYVVHGKSASKGYHQADLDAMLTDMRAGVIKVLVIWHSDRIERRPGKALLDLLAEVSDAGGRVESVKEPTLGQLDFGSQVTTFIAGLVNHEKSQHLSEQIGLAHDRIRANGALTGRPPFGYTSEGGKYNRAMVPTGDGRRFVPGIYRRVIAGESLNTIARWLDSAYFRATGPALSIGVMPAGFRKIDPDHIRPARGSGSWHARSLGILVRCSTYMGHRTDAAGRTILRCEALVDAVTFRRAGEALDNRPKRGPVHEENRALLSGVLFCARCENSPMYRTLGGGPQARTAYYRCAGRGPQRQGCGNLVRVAELDNQVDELLSAAVLPIMAERLVPGHNHSARLEEIKFEMRELAARDLDDDVYDAELTRLRAERDDLKSRPSVPDRVERVDTGTTYAARWAAQDGTERGNWLRSLGVRIYAERGTRPDLATVAIPMVTEWLAA